MIEFEVRHTADGLRRAYAQWWRDRFARSYWIAFGLSVAALVWMMTLRSAPWPLVVVATASILYTAYVRTLRDAVIGRVLKQNEGLSEDGLKYTLTPEAIRERSSMGDVELRWSTFDALHIQPDAALLLRKPREANAFIVFPKNQFPAEARLFIEERLRATVEL
ncbi:MAG: hypothetical protein ABI672_20460 [Vicinamibacteria bacterium]